MTEDRVRELYEIAGNAADEILESWWHEIGSWDGYLEDEELTYEELDWIWNNIKVQALVK